jgi:hypothetical protein
MQFSGLCRDAGKSAKRGLRGLRVDLAKDTVGQLGTELPNESECAGVDRVAFAVRSAHTITLSAPGHGRAGRGFDSPQASTVRPGRGWTDALVGGASCAGPGARSNAALATTKKLERLNLRDYNDR